MITVVFIVVGVDVVVGFGCYCSKREELFVVIVFNMFGMLLMLLLLLLLCCFVVRVKSKGADMLPNVKMFAVLLALCLVVCKYGCLKTLFKSLFPKAEPIIGPPSRSMTDPHLGSKF